MCLTSVKKNTVYARSQTQQVYTITLPTDTLGELTVNSRQKPEWLWQSREMALPLMSVNASSSIMNAAKTGRVEETRTLAKGTQKFSYAS